MIEYTVKCRVVNGPTSSGPNPARSRKYKPEPGPSRKINLKPKSCPKKSESKVRSKKFTNIAKLFLLFFCTAKTKSTYQVRIKSDIFVNFRPEPGPNSARTRTRPEKPGPTYNSSTIYSTTLHYYVWYEIKVLSLFIDCQLLLHLFSILANNY